MEHGSVSLISSQDDLGPRSMDMSWGDWPHDGFAEPDTSAAEQDTSAEFNLSAAAPPHQFWAEDDTPDEYDSPGVIADDNSALRLERHDGCQYAFFHGRSTFFPHPDCGCGEYALRYS